MNHDNDYQSLPLTVTSEDWIPIAERLAEQIPAHIMGRGQARLLTSIALVATIIDHALAMMTNATRETGVFPESALEITKLWAKTLAEANVKVSELAALGAEVSGSPLAASFRAMAERGKKNLTDATADDTGGLQMRTVVSGGETADTLTTEQLRRMFGSLNDDGTKH